MQAATANRTWQGLEELREALWCFLRRYTPDDNEIEDVIQETFVRAARYRVRLEDPRRLKPWAMRIARNVLADHHRRDLRYLSESQLEEGLDGLPTPVQEEGPNGVRIGATFLDQESAVDQLRRAMTQLREEDRRVLRSFYGGPGSCRETAGECGIPPHLVKIRLFRARRRLLRLLRHRVACSEGPRVHGVGVS